MRRFSVLCKFGKLTAPVDLYFGSPAPLSHPLEAQSKWLHVKRSGTIPADVMSSLQALSEIAKREGGSFELLCASCIPPDENGGASISDHVDMKTIVKRKVVSAELYKSRLSRSKSPTETEKRRLAYYSSIGKTKNNQCAVRPNEFTYSAENDLLLAGTDDDLSRLLFQLADLINLQANDRHYRLLFVCFCFAVIKKHLLVANDCPASLNEVYNQINRNTDHSYYFAVAADTLGGAMPLFCRNFMCRYAARDSGRVNFEVAVLKANLTLFAVRDLPNSTETNPFAAIMQKKLRKELTRHSN